jgi:SnoaL-like domain
MKRHARSREGPSIACAVVLLAVAAALVAAGCGDSTTSASSSPTAGASSPSASILPAAEPVSTWDKPGSASAGQTLAIARRYAAALHAEKVKTGLYAPAATWHVWSSDATAEGPKEIAAVYRDVAGYADWSKGHVFAAPGVAAAEGQFTVYGTSSTPYLTLLAADGDKIVHEEVYINDGDTAAVKVYGAAPGPKDTAAVAAKVGAAVGDAFATGDHAALQALVAPDVMFRDVAQKQGVRGWDALLSWWDNVPTVTLTNKAPVAGRGWSVVRWTIRRDYSTGVQLAMPGATMMEVRDGKVVRMTVYYDSANIRLQE